MTSHEYKFIFSEKEDAEDALELVVDKTINFSLDIKYLALVYYENEQKVLYSADKTKCNWISLWYELTFCASFDLIPNYFVATYFHPLYRFWTEKD